MTITGLLDDLGEALAVEGWKIQPGANALIIEGWEKDVADDSDQQERVRKWNASQEPVEKLRYPRAAEKNRKGVTVGGHTWFSRHARPKQGDKDSTPVGLIGKVVRGDLKKQMVEDGAEFDAKKAMVAAQVLPDLEPADPSADLLYGYDGFAERGGLDSLEEFDPQKHLQGNQNRGPRTRRQ